MSEQASGGEAGAGAAGPGGAEGAGTSGAASGNASGGGQASGGVAGAGAAGPGGVEGLSTSAAASGNALSGSNTAGLDMNMPEQMTPDQMANLESLAADLEGDPSLIDQIMDNPFAQIALSGLIGPMGMMALNAAFGKFSGIKGFAASTGLNALGVPSNMASLMGPAVTADTPQQAAANVAASLTGSATSNLMGGDLAGQLAGNLAANQTGQAVASASGSPQGPSAASEGQGDTGTASGLNAAQSATRGGSGGNMMSAGAISRDLGKPLSSQVPQNMFSSYQQDPLNKFLYTRPDRRRGMLQYS